MSHLCGCEKFSLKMSWSFSTTSSTWMGIKLPYCRSDSSRIPRDRWQPHEWGLCHTPSTGIVQVTLWHHTTCPAETHTFTLPSTNDEQTRAVSLILAPFKRDDVQQRTSSTNWNTLKLLCSSMKSTDVTQQGYKPVRLYKLQLRFC